MDIRPGELEVAIPVDPEEIEAMGKGGVDGVF